ncbi:hypothetical protein ND2E_4108 [Colwellia psychrerythraea]|uniref:Uncharacterized protein n=1 Tax=Colwellia psychrerythraea TaxID=28229 RepID=A0A099KE20_COLPS|nr:hypothetical protein ND2E_4108 [Colwellia psychrerythraea]
MKCTSIPLKNLVILCGLLISSNAISNENLPQSQAVHILMHRDHLIPSKPIT